MEPSEFKELQALARRRRTSVASLVRDAVRSTYLTPKPDREAAGRSILEAELPLISWKDAKAEIEAAHDGLP
jgi:hypothetical protein